MKKSLVFTLGLLASSILSAQTEQHVVVAPKCLVKQSHEQYKNLASTDAFLLLQTNAKGINKLIKLKHKQKSCGGFIDVTDAWKMFSLKGNDPKTFLSNYTKSFSSSKKSDYKIQYPTEVNKLLKQLNPQMMWDNLTTLTAFDDRFAGSNNGVKAAEWIKTQIENIAKSNQRNDISVYFVNTGMFYKQPSVVVKVGTSNLPGIVIGGHLDTLQYIVSRKPGADDDGTGSVTVLETARTILSSGMHFKKPIYFIWYAAEEMGLVGSQHVVADFKNKNIPVDAVLQLDMTGYAHNNSPTMWLIKDHVNPDLTNYLEALIKEYVKQPVSYTQCGYACSDHASWHGQGFAAAFPAEAAFENSNPDIHTSRDTMEKLSLDHMKDYVKLAAAFAVELAEPVKQ